MDIPKSPKDLYRFWKDDWPSIPRGESKPLSPPPTRQDNHRIVVEARSEMNLVDHIAIYGHEIALHGLHSFIRGVRDKVGSAINDVADEIRAIQEQPGEVETPGETAHVQETNTVQGTDNQT